MCAHTHTHTGKQLQPISCLYREDSTQAGWLKCCFLHHESQYRRLQLLSIPCLCKISLLWWTCKGPERIISNNILLIPSTLSSCTWEVTSLINWTKPSLFCMAYSVFVISLTGNQTWTLEKLHLNSKIDLLILISLWKNIRKDRNGWSWAEADSWKGPVLPSLP